MSSIFAAIPLALTEGSIADYHVKNLRMDKKMPSVPQTLKAQCLDLKTFICYSIGILTYIKAIICLLYVVLKISSKEKNI